MARKKTAVQVTDTIQVGTVTGPKRTKPVPFDLQALLVAIDGKGAIWQKTGLMFDHAHVQVTGYVLLLDDPARSLAFQVYDGKVSAKFMARVEAGEGGPVKDVAVAIEALRKRGYSLVAPPAAAPIRRRRGKAR
jgi:hypothetical protein